MAEIPLIDVFAGPGGLNEGFSSLSDVQGRPIFRASGSYESDPVACETLALRAAVRAARRTTGAFPADYYRALRGEIPLAQLYASAEFRPFLKEAKGEVHRVELGVGTRDLTDPLIDEDLSAVNRGDTPWVLIGGPPCQAYSLAGRSRRKGDPSFATDSRHVLYREYLHIIRRFRPAVFVMENVKGMLSSEHDGGKVFQRILEDLAAPTGGLSYSIKSLVKASAGEITDPSEYVIRSEEYGIPQKRHRVILLGIRSDIVVNERLSLVPHGKSVTVDAAIGGLPRVRASLRPTSSDTPEAWRLALNKARAYAGMKPLSRVYTPSTGGHFVRAASDCAPSDQLTRWFHDPNIGGVVQHQGRGHMEQDLIRYAYLAQMGVREGRSLRLSDLPEDLLPKHKSAAAAGSPFADRFRVQIADDSSSTIVSHIAKDGHYYIHPDPKQMRSLTVREAARLQTFPDNYLFVGSRTHQYHQVGNAVPPLLARQVGEVVARLLGHDVGAD